MPTRQPPCQPGSHRSRRRHPPAGAAAGCRLSAGAVEDVRARASVIATGHGACHAGFPSKGPCWVGRRPAGVCVLGLLPNLISAHFHPLIIISAVPRHHPCPVTTAMSRVARARRGVHDDGDAAGPASDIFRLVDQLEAQGETPGRLSLRLRRPTANPACSQLRSASGASCPARRTR